MYNFDQPTSGENIQRVKFLTRATHAKNESLRGWFEGGDTHFATFLPEMAEYDDFEDSFESSSESDTDKQPYETKEDKWDQSYEQCETIPHVKSAQCELELSSDIALQ